MKLVRPTKKITSRVANYSARGHAYPNSAARAASDRALPLASQRSRNLNSSFTHPRAHLSISFPWKACQELLSITWPGTRTQRRGDCSIPSPSNLINRPRHVNRARARAHARWLNVEPEAVDGRENLEEVYGIRIRVKTVSEEKCGRKTRQEN